MAETAFVEDVLAPSCKIEGCPNEAEAPTDGRLLAQWARVGTSRRTKSRQILILPEKRQVHPKAF
jgi:hypothetical protein